MKLIFIIITFFAVSCQAQQQPTNLLIKPHESQVQCKSCPGLIISNNGHDTTLMITKHEYDSMKNEIHLLRFKVERVKYYSDIVLRKPSQLKFLNGWVRRAIR